MIKELKSLPLASLKAAYQDPFLRSFWIYWVFLVIIFILYH